MAATSIYYNDGSVREDLLGVISNISPRETQLMTGLGTSVATSVRHEWLNDTLSAVKYNAYAEGVDASYAVTSPTRTINYTQIIRQGYDVSDTQQSVEHAGFADRYAYEASKAMAIWKNDAELAVLQGSLVCGTSAAPTRSMNGIVAFIVATNVTDQSGISLSETTLLAYLERVWNYGASVDEVYVSSTLKKRIDGFSSNGATRVVAPEDRRLVNAIDVYVSSFAPLVKIFLHRYANTNSLTATISNANNIYGIDSKYYKIAYLRKPAMRDLAKTGDSTKGEVFGELCLEDRAAGQAAFCGSNHF